MELWNFQIFINGQLNSAIDNFFIFMIFDTEKIIEVFAYFRLSNLKRLQRLILDKNQFQVPLNDDLFHQINDLEDVRMKDCSISYLPLRLVYSVFGTMYYAK